MKAVLQILETDTIVELDNLTYDSFRMIGSKPYDDNFMIMERYGIGKPIIIITSNMPDNLQKQIKDLISNYCNH
jgi:hypothetical protein